MRIAHRMHRTHRIIFILFFSVFSVFSVLFSPVRSRALRGCALCATRISSIIKTHHRHIYCNSVLSVAPYSNPIIAPCSTLPPCTPSIRPSATECAASRATILDTPPMLKFSAPLMAPNNAPWKVDLSICPKFCPLRIIQ